MDTAYYINGGVANDKTVNPSLVTIEINNNELTVSSPSASSRGAGFIVPVSPSTSYTISCNTSGATVGDTESVIVCGFLTQNGTITRYDAARGSNPIVTLTTNNDEYYVYLVFRKMSGTLTYSNIMLVEGSTAPSSYIPYGNIWQPINPKKLKGIPYTGTLPATLTGTKAGYLYRYKIYGNASENLFDGALLRGYYENINSINDRGTSGYTFRSFRIQGLPAGTYTVAWGIPVRLVRVWLNNAMRENVAQNITSYTVNTSNGDIAFSFRDERQGVYWDDSTWVMLVAGSTVPDHYIPYEECGERTENLLKIEPGMLDAANWTLRPAATATYFMYYLLSEDTADRLRRIGTVAGTTYLIPGGSYYSGEILAITSSMKATGVTNAERLLQNNGTQLQYSADVSGYTDIYLCIGYGPGITSSNQQLLVDSMFDNYDIMLNVGTVPLPYEPYGYKLPLTSGSTPVDIYIGDDTLSTEEYVDSSAGKVYRMVGGTLTPVDPPIPFPQIPTSANSTTISWAGEGLAPSQFDSIQEWVDIPTYTYTNGEWVVDNSN